MDNKAKLILVKSLHSAVWAVMAAASLYILYSGVAGSGGKLLRISVGLLVAESIVLAFNGWVCPLTPIAMRYTDERAENFDIYLPRLVAKYNKAIFGAIFVAGLSLVLVNAIFRQP